MLHAALAEQWPIDDEPEASGKLWKPKRHKLHNAILDDKRLGMAARFLAAYRARRSANWSCSEPDLKRDHGFGADLFYASIKELRKHGYMQRTQQKDAKGDWSRAAEKFNPHAKPANGRKGYLLVCEDDIAGLPWRQAILLDYLRSLPRDFISPAEKIAKHFAVHVDTARRHLKPLVAAGLATIKNEREGGKIKLKGYAAISPCGKKPPAATASPCRQKPNTQKPNTQKPNTPLGTYSSEKTNSPVQLSEKVEKSATSSPGAMPRQLFSGEGEGRKKSSTYAERKAARERREIDQLYKRTGVEPFTKAATFEEAVKQVSSDLAWKANRGIEIDDDGDGKHLVQIEFHDSVDDAAFGETYTLSDRRLREGIKRATAGRVKAALVGKEGLQTVRLMLARLMEDAADAEEAFDILLAYLRKRIGSVEKAWLNSWNLVAHRFAGELYCGGIDDLLPDPGSEAKALASKFKARDWNACLAPHLFTERGLAGLEVIIGLHGAEAVDDAVSEYIARSKTDRTIEPGHVKNWMYFIPAIVTQGRSKLERE